MSFWYQEETWGGAEGGRPILGEEGGVDSGSASLLLSASAGHLPAGERRGREGGALRARGALPQGALPPARRRRGGRPRRREAPVDVDERPADSADGDGANHTRQ